VATFVDDSSLDIELVCLINCLELFNPSRRFALRAACKACRGWSFGWTWAKAKRTNAVQLSAVIRDVDFTDLPVINIPPNVFKDALNNEKYGIRVTGE